MEANCALQWAAYAFSYQIDDHHKLLQIVFYTQETWYSLFTSETLIALHRKDDLFMYFIVPVPLVGAHFMDWTPQRRNYVLFIYTGVPSEVLTYADIYFYINNSIAIIIMIFQLKKQYHVITTVQKSLSRNRWNRSKVDTTICKTYIQMYMTITVYSPGLEQTLHLFFYFFCILDNNESPS